MENIEKALKELENNDGLTLKNGKPIEHKSGYQVADYGVVVNGVYEALSAIHSMGGNCGVWLSDGKFYIDHSFRVPTKKQAVRIGKQHNQQSILAWKDKSLVWL